MNVCMFSPFSTKASCTRRLISFAKELIRRGHTVSITLPSFDRHSGFTLETVENFDGIKLSHPFQLKVRKMEVATFSYTLSSSLSSLFLRCDIIHVLKPTPITWAGYLGKILYGTPIIQDIDDLDHAVMIAEKHPKMRIWFMRQSEKLLPKLADYVVTCSSLLKRIYIDLGVEQDKITWIPQGVNVSEFEVKSDLSIKAKYNLRDKVVVYLGALNNDVQVYPLIKAMKLIIAKRKDVSCLIIGDGSARSFYERLVHNLGLGEFVAFTGFVPHEDVPKLLSISDIGFACFVPPLIPTGGLMKVFEYMASRVPVVVNQSGDLPYYIDYGKAGAITKLDPESLSSTLIQLLDDDRKRKKMGKHAYEYVKENFDWKILTEQLIRIYKSAQARMR